MALKNKNNGGFSLIEITIVLIIGGLLFALLADSLLTAQQQAKVDVTRERIKAIDEAIRNYSLLNYRLPCVARRNAAPDTTNFAVELTNCTAAPVGTETSRSAIGTNTARIGTVPTRTLNLPDSYGYDGWGTRFTYAVIESAASTATFNISQTTGNGIGVVDVATPPNSLITPARSLSYIVVSHGENKVGGFNIQGFQTIACNTTTNEGENCDNDSLFRSTTITSTRIADATTFDDIVSYSGNFAEPGIPSGAIVAFEAGCPPVGWAPAAGLEGRVIIGAGTNVVINPPLAANTPPRTSFTDYPSGSTGGGTYMRNSAGPGEVLSLPPYTAYVYCTKL